MKWRVKNLETGNFVSEACQYEKAEKLAAQLNWKEKKYKAVPIEMETEKLSTEFKPMSEDVKSAIPSLLKIAYAPGTNHSSFANNMLQRVNEKNFEISEKEEAYLWYIVHRYRRQITDRKIVQTSVQNKVY